jgi:hypothetical protein
MNAKLLESLLSQLTTWLQRCENSQKRSIPYEMTLDMREIDGLQSILKHCLFACLENLGKNYDAGKYQTIKRVRGRGKDGTRPIIRDEWELDEV